jgi:hypothetical protein
VTFWYHSDHQPETNITKEKPTLQKEHPVTVSYPSGHT